LFPLFATGINDTSGTGGKFATGVNYTSGTLHSLACVAFFIGLWFLRYCCYRYEPKLKQIGILPIKNISSGLLKQLQCQILVI
jgi:hypothetical protein